MIVPIGAIADQGSSQEAEVVFSIEEVDEVLVDLPSQFTRVGKFVKFGPQGFIFNIPITIMLPGSSEDNPSEYAIAHLDIGTENWELLPVTNIDADNYLVGTDVHELGTYALVKLNRDGLSTRGNQNQLQAECTSCDGGVRLYPKSPYSQSNYFVLTIRDVEFKYSWANQYYSGLVGNSASTPSNAPATAPNHPLKWILPQGNYSFYVSALIPDGTFHKNG